MVQSKSSLGLAGVIREGMEYSFYAAAGPQPDGSCWMFYWIRCPRPPLTSPPHSVRARNRSSPAGEHMFPTKTTGTYGALVPKFPFDPDAV